MASQGFDVSGAILAFLADTTRTSLELPHMTTGQRKQTKKLVEQHPELTCESYGFGEERQLHLFKRRQETEIVFGEQPCKVDPDSAAWCSYESAGLAGGAVSVKNTFIDDFVENGSDDEAQKFQAVRSMPPALSRILLDSTDGKREVEVSSTTTSSGQSTDSTSSSPREEHELPSPMKVPLGVATPSGLEVRNTFIHYTQPADKRIVQSMPHGMFGQCLIAEFLGDASFTTQEATPPAARQTVQEQRPTITPLTSVLDIAAEEGTLAPGTEVVITGLSKLPAFNGLEGTIQSFDEETARFSILLIEPAGGHKWVKVKRENLNLVMSLPPPPSPSSYFPEVQATPTWEEHPMAHSFFV